MTSESFTDSESRATEAILRRFNDVFMSHEPAGLADLVAENCVIENTEPAPDGSRHEGKEACIALWTRIATLPTAHFELEGIIARRPRRDPLAARLGRGPRHSVRPWRQSDAGAERPDRRGARLCEGLLIPSR